MCNTFGFAQRGSREADSRIWSFVPARLPAFFAGRGARVSETRRDARQRREAGRGEGDSQGCSLEPLSFPYFFGGAKKYGWVWASSPKDEEKHRVWAGSPKDEEKSQVWAGSPKDEEKNRVWAGSPYQYLFERERMNPYEAVVYKNAGVRQ